MCVSAVKIISVLAVLMALCAHALPVAAQDASGDFDMPERTADINASSGFADAGGIKLDITQDGILLALDADNPACIGKSLICEKSAGRRPSPCQVFTQERRMSP
jgi:hypothetical protein